MAILFLIVFVYDKNNVKIYTLMPVIGTVLLILYASKETLVARFLSLKLFVSIGLIITLIYCINQYLLLPELGGGTLMFFLSLLTLVLAYLTWRFSRNRSFISQKNILSTLTLIIPNWFGSTVWL